MKSRAVNTIIIVSEKVKPVLKAHRRGTITLGRCFREIGFRVQIAKSLDPFFRLPIRRFPDIIAIDYDLGTATMDTLEDLISKHIFPKHTMILLYNFPTPELIHTRRFHRNTYYLGDSFTDRDLFIVTSRILSQRVVNGNHELPALQGEIIDESLLEVLQLLEIGKKTGCLLVQYTEPIGLVYVLEGKIIYAATINCNGKDALMEMLSLTGGTFKFALDKKTNARNCNLSISKLLMEWVHTVDETKNLRALLQAALR